MLGFPTAPGRRALAITCTVRLAFRLVNNVGIRV
jgi:hypothetical protein